MGLYNQPVMTRMTLMFSMHLKTESSQNTTKSEVKSNSLFKDGTKAVDNNNIMATSPVFNSMEAKIALSIMAIIIIFNLRLNNINNMFKFRLNNLGTSVRSSNTKTAIMMLILGIVTVIIMTSRNSKRLLICNTHIQS